MTKRKDQKSSVAPARNEAIPAPLGSDATATAPAALATAKDDTSRVAQHDLLDQSGNVLSDDSGEEAAYGMRYTLLANGQHVDYQYGVSADADRMFAVFGAKTLATNQASQARHNPKGAGTADEQIQAVRDRFALVATGTWVERTREGAAKVDKDALCEAIVQEQIATGATRKDGTPITQELADQGYKAEVRQKLEDDAIFLRNARQVPGISNRYAALIGKGIRSIADLAM